MPRHNLQFRFHYRLLVSLISPRVSTESDQSHGYWRARAPRKQFPRRLLLTACRRCTDNFPLPARRVLPRKLRSYIIHQGKKSRQGSMGFASRIQSKRHPRCEQRGAVRLPEVTDRRPMSFVLWRISSLTFSVRDWTTTVFYRVLIEVCRSKRVQHSLSNYKNPARHNRSFKSVTTSFHAAGNAQNLRRSRGMLHEPNLFRKSVLTTRKPPSSARFRIAREPLKRGKTRASEHKRAARIRTRSFGVMILVNGTANWCSKGSVKSFMEMSIAILLVQTAERCQASGVE